MKRLIVTGLCFPLVACGLQPVPDDGATVAPDPSVDASTQIRPVARPEGQVVPVTAVARPPVGANTAETLDTTTPEQRAAAAAPEPPAETSSDLGLTVASLGSPTEPGFWLKTPLVSKETQGRVTNPANGKSATVTLIPIDGPKTAGSRMSLPAMRLIDASLTDLTEVRVSLAG